MEKNNVRKLPIYEKYRWYSLTFNPHDDYQFIGSKSGKHVRALDPRDRFEKFHAWFYEMCFMFTKKCKYRFSIDISQPSSQSHKSAGPRLHIHGRILFTCNGSIMDWQMSQQNWLLKFGHLEIDTIDDISKWDDYCDKYVHIHKKKPFTNVPSEALAHGKE